MAFNPVSFFAGIGTVFVAIAVGFGGGLLLTSSVKTEPPNRLERVAGSMPLPTPSAPQASSPAVQTPTVQTPTVSVVTPAPASTPAPVSEANASVPSQQAAAPSQPAAAPQPPAAETPKPPAAETTQAANQQSAVANDPPASVRESAAKPQDEDNDARRIAEKKRAEHRKWAERKRRQQELETATDEVRKIDRNDRNSNDRRYSDDRNDDSPVIVRRDDDSPVIVRRDIVETPRLGFFGQ
jgi:hypothetical protein